MDLGLSDFDVGFICGLVTGEGSFTGDRRQAALAIKLHQNDPEPLQFIEQRLGGKSTVPIVTKGVGTTLAINEKGALCCIVSVL